MTTVPANPAAIRVDDATREAYRRDGVVALPRALSGDTLGLARDAWEWSRTHPGPGAARLPSKGPGEFHQDLANPRAFTAYARLLAAPEIGAIVAGLWNRPEVWFMYEQIFEKSGGATRRTPWHQDSSYLPVRGARFRDPAFPRVR